MTVLSKDPLIGVLRAIIAFVMGVLAFVILMLAVGAVALPFFQAELGVELAADSAKEITVWQAIAMAEGLLLGIIALLAMAEYFFLLLWRVLASVREGDPFVPANSERLTRMAWTALAGNIWGIVLGIYAAWAETFIADEAIEGDLNFDSGGGGLVLILVLFVLARVFRYGTVMREDLEGTV